MTGGNGRRRTRRRRHAVEAEEADAADDAPGEPSPPSAKRVRRVEPAEASERELAEQAAHRVIAAGAAEEAAADTAVAAVFQERSPPADDLEEDDEEEDDEEEDEEEGKEEEEDDCSRFANDYRRQQQEEQQRKQQQRKRRRGQATVQVQADILQQEDDEEAVEDEDEDEDWERDDEEEESDDHDEDSDDDDEEGYWDRIREQVSNEGFEEEESDDDSDDDFFCDLENEAAIDELCAESLRIAADETSGLPPGAPPDGLNNTVWINKTWPKTNGRLPPPPNYRMSAATIEQWRLYSDEDQVDEAKRYKNLPLAAKNRISRLIPGKKKQTKAAAARAAAKRAEESSGGRSTRNNGIARADVSAISLVDDPMKRAKAQSKNGRKSRPYRRRGERPTRPSETATRPVQLSESALLVAVAKHIQMITPLQRNDGDPRTRLVLAISRQVAESTIEGGVIPGQELDLTSAPSHRHDKHQLSDEHVTVLSSNYDDAVHVLGMAKKALDKHKTTQTSRQCKFSVFHDDDAISSGMHGILVPIQERNKIRKSRMTKPRKGVRDNSETNDQVPSGVGSQETPSGPRRSRRHGDNGHMI